MRFKEQYKWISNEEGYTEEAKSICREELTKNWNTRQMKWEYKTQIESGQIPCTEMLNKMGEQGWELASVIKTCPASVEFIFKRQIEMEPSFEDAVRMAGLRIPERR